MDKNIIKKHLTERFLSEDKTPGITVTDAAKKESKKINQEGVKAIEKDVTSYDKDLKQQDENMDTMAPNKFNYANEEQKTYHNEVEISNGLEQTIYGNEPNDEFKKRAEQAILGDSIMANEGGIGNAESAWGASSNEFADEFLNNAKSSFEKRLNAQKGITSFGDDIESTAKGVHQSTKFSAYESNQNNNKKTKIKEGMKRLKFKNEFNGVGNALKLIPESYKVDNKEFEMTDGNETYRIRWEGSLNEGNAVVLTATDKKMVTEDMARMKALFGYKSQDTLGLVKGNARIDENKVFGDIWNKSKRLLGESEEIEGQTADKEAPFEEADVKQASEAKEHVEGSVSTDKGTVAPKPKEGHWEDNVKGQAAEAKKHVHMGTASTDKGGVAPKPKEGEWEDVKKKASEATEHINEGVTLGGIRFEPINESIIEQELEEGIELEEGFTEFYNDEKNKEFMKTAPYSDNSLEKIDSYEKAIRTANSKDWYKKLGPEKSKKLKMDIASRFGREYKDGEFSDEEDY